MKAVVTRLVAAFVASTIAIVVIYYVEFVGTEFWHMADGFDALIPAALIVSLANVMAVILPTSLILRTTRRLRPLWFAIIGAVGGLFTTTLYLAVMLNAAFHFDPLAVIGGLGGLMGALVWWAIEARFWQAIATSGNA